MENNDVVIMAEYDINEAEAGAVGPQHFTKIINRNFAGNPTEYNPTGRRQFTVRLPGDIAAAMAADGWNVKVREAEDGSSSGYLTVDATSNDKFKPAIVQVVKQSNGKYRKQYWPEANLAELDSAQLKNVKLRVRPYHYTAAGRSGIKAYLSTMYFEMVADPFDAEYDWDDMPAPSFDIPFDSDDI